MKTTLLIILIALGTSQFVYLVFQSPLGFVIWFAIWVIWFAVRFHFFFTDKWNEEGDDDNDNY